MKQLRHVKRTAKLLLWANIYQLLSDSITTRLQQTKLSLSHPYGAAAEVERTSIISFLAFHKSNRNDSIVTGMTDSNRNDTGSQFTEENIIQGLVSNNIIKNDSQHFDCNIQTIQLFTIEYFIILETTELSKTKTFFQESPGNEVRAHSVANISSCHLTIAFMWLGLPVADSWSLE